VPVPGPRMSLMGCLGLHDPADVQQTSSKCIQNTHANAGRLLEVCWTFAGSCKHPNKAKADIIALVVQSRQSVNILWFLHYSPTQLSRSITSASAC